MKSAKIKIACALTLMIGTFLYSSCQKEYQKVNREEKQISPVINFTPAKTSSELMALRLDKSANLIRTVEDFDKVVSSNNTPLNKLDREQLLDFKKSLVVRDSIGVVSLHYGILKQALSYDDFATVLEMFGLDIKEGFWGLSNDPAIQAKLIPSQSTQAVTAVGGDITTNSVGKDYEGYLCSQQKTCTKAKDYICMSGC